jgi:selenocysteine lyase/cysteine desulfurase
MELPEDASRFEYTTIHFGAALGLAAAVEEINEIGIEEVWRHDLALADLVIDGARLLGIEVVSPLSDSERSAIVSLRLPEGVSSEEISRRLQDEYSILVTSRAGLLRVSSHIDNTEGDIQSLLEALKHLVS